MSHRCSSITRLYLYRTFILLYCSRTASLTVSSQASISVGTGQFVHHSPFHISSSRLIKMSSRNYYYGSSSSSRSSSTSGGKLPPSSSSYRMSSNSSTVHSNTANNGHIGPNDSSNNGQSFRPKQSPKIIQDSSYRDTDRRTKNQDVGYYQ